MTYRPNLLATVASVTQAGVIKPDGITITVGTDAVTSVTGTTVTALTDISSGMLGGPAASDVDTLNRAGTDYKTTLSSRASFFRKTPAGSRTITLVNGSNNAVLTSADNDKQIVIAGVSGSVSGDGTISDGFSCFIVNKTGSALSYSGIVGLGSLTALPVAGAARVYMAASAFEAAMIGGSYVLPPATTTTLGGVKADGVSISALTDGTLSVISTTTHALPAGSNVSATDEIATFSSSSSSDVKYSLAQITAYIQTNLQSWLTAARPVLGSSQFVIGFNVTLGRFEFWNGSTWNQHVRLSDLSATANQLFGGSGTSGVAIPINVGSGLQINNGTLTSIQSVVPVTTITTSGPSQALAFSLSGSRAYDVTLTANCSFTVSGGSTGELQTLTLVVRGGAGGFLVNLPGNVRWKGGSPPSVDTSAGAVYVVRIQTSDGGVTYAGNF